MRGNFTARRGVNRPFNNSGNRGGGFNRHGSQNRHFKPNPK